MWAAKCGRLVLALSLGWVSPLGARENVPSPSPQPAFPEPTPKPTRAPNTPAVSTPRNNPLRRDRIQRRVREPAYWTNPAARPVEKSAPATLPERLGRTRERATSPVAVSPTAGGSVLAAPAQPTLETYAPFGRLIKCELVFTVDSVGLQSPIIALVREEVAWQGEVIIPAGTEVFGRAVADRVQNRIGDDGKWTLVLPRQGEAAHGREWIVQGRALDRAEVEVDTQGRGRAWSDTDGAPGLQGYVIDEANSQRIQLFITTALAGAVQGFSRGLQNRVPAAGNAGRRGDEVVSATVRNASLEAGGQATREALELLAKEILQEVQRHGSYVRVPAGKTFYLFVEQTLDPTDAAVGRRRIPSSP